MKHTPVNWKRHCTPRADMPIRRAGVCVIVSPMKTTLTCLLVGAVAAVSLVSCAASESAAGASGSTISIGTPMTPPAWAELERKVLADNVPAAREFFPKYYDNRGYLQCFVRWGADDGADDAFENFNGWPDLHAVGASDELQD